MNAAHICQPEFMGLNGMRDVYNRLGLLPTSENADIILIRSHVAYWSGSKEAERVTIKPSRGHSYRVFGGSWSNGKVVRITDHYDHREGVQGWN